MMFKFTYLHPHHTFPLKSLLSYVFIFFKVINHIKRRFSIVAIWKFADIGFHKLSRRNLFDVQKFYCTNNNIKILEQNNIRNIVLCHPKTRNSLSLEMMTTLQSAISKDCDDKNLRVIVISSEGPVFSAGHNLKELTSTTGKDYHKEVFNMATKLMTSIIESPVPVIAKVNGLAAAAGCQLVATCDIVICSEKSTFSTPGANFGIFCSTPGIAVGRCVPKSRAMTMLFTGLPITSQEAYISGLVSRVVPEEQLDDEVNAVCDAIKAKSRTVVALGKQFYYKQISKPVLEAFKMGEEIMVQNINMEDGQEGIMSFAEKRKPVWKH